MPAPNAKAIETAEEILRKLRTGELTGFVAVATDDDDLSACFLAGHVNLTSTVCLLEEMKLRALSEWMERFESGKGPDLGLLTQLPVAVTDTDTGEKDESDS